MQQACNDESGFTLIELLVVILILGVLSAIALAAFFGQREKASDAEAKSTAHTAVIAMDSCGIEANNRYESCDLEELRALEPTLPSAPVLEVSGLGENEYTIVVESVPPGRTYTVERTGEGEIEYTCVENGKGGCPLSGEWG